MTSRLADRIAQDIDRALALELPAIHTSASADFANGRLTEAEYEVIDARIVARREIVLVSRAAAQDGHRTVPRLRPTAYPPRSRPRSPDRAASRERRRDLSGSGHLPSKLRALFTPGEAAVLLVIAAQVQRTGQCELHVDAIAAMAGVCARLVQLTLRLASHHGLIAVEYRRRPGTKSLPNVVTIISAEWRQWLARGPRHRVKNASPHEESQKNLSPLPSLEAPSRAGFRGCRRSEGFPGTWKHEGARR